MARALTPQDVHKIVTEIGQQVTGQKNFDTVASGNFVSAGETIMAAGTENVLNALSLVIGRTLVTVRPYNAKLKILNAINTGAYTHRLRKISYYTKEAKEVGAYNTNIKGKNLYNGYDNGKNGGSDATASMWEQDKPVAVEMNFAGTSTWQECLTIYEHQLKTAFQSEANFADFLAGIMTNKANEIELRKEAFNRMLLLNAIASTYKAGAAESVVNLTAAYNAKFHTSHTSEQLRTTYLQSFLQFMTARINADIRKMGLFSKLYHISPTKTVDGETYDTILRQTRKEDLRLMLYGPLMDEAKTMVYPEIFRTDGLDIRKQYEDIDFWQSIDNPTSIKVVPSYFDVNSGGQMVDGTVELPYVVGFMFDKDMLMIDYQLDDVSTTPKESRKHYRNTWWTISRNAIQDPTMNCCLYIMADEG